MMSTNINNVDLTGNIASFGGAMSRARDVE